METVFLCFTLGGKRIRAHRRFDGPMLFSTLCLHSLHFMEHLAFSKMENGFPMLSRQSSVSGQEHQICSARYSFQAKWISIPQSKHCHYLIHFPEVCLSSSIFLCQDYILSVSRPPTFNAPSIYNHLIHCIRLFLSCPCAFPNHLRCHSFIFILQRMAFVAKQVKNENSIQQCQLEGVDFYNHMI